MYFTSFIGNIDYFSRTCLLTGTIFIICNNFFNINFPLKAAWVSWKYSHEKRIKSPFSQLIFFMKNYCAAVNEQVVYKREQEKFACDENDRVQGST